MLRQTSECGGYSLDHPFVGRRDDLLGQHPQQLAVHVVIVLAIAGHAAGTPDCGVPGNVVTDLHTMHEADALGRGEEVPPRARPGSSLRLETVSQGGLIIYDQASTNSGQSFREFEQAG
jgi:hypothetical protein